MTGYVYALSNGRGAVKIGFSRNPKHRIESLRHISPDDMHLIGVMPGSEADEKAAHRELSHARIRGEWFSSEDIAVKDFISVLERSGGLGAVDTKIGGRLREWRVREGMTVLAASVVLGVSPGTVSRLENSVICVSSGRVLDVERITGISRHELRPDIYPEPVEAAQ